jgi:hypothetical protein
MYANPTYLKSKSLTPDVFLFNRGTSEVVTLAAPTLATLGDASLDELIFYINSNDGRFYTGDPSRNSDGFAHANVTGSPFSYTVSFEDQLNGGDLSYGNAIFSVQSSTPVPGPLPILGALTALNGSRRLRRRLRRRVGSPAAPQ